jgi:hypothetical protein
MERTVEVFEYRPNFDKNIYNEQIAGLISKYEHTDNMFILVHDIREIYRFSYVVNFYALICGAIEVIKILGSNFDLVNIIITKEQGSKYESYINNFVEIMRNLIDMKHLRIELEIV